MFSYQAETSHVVCIKTIRGNYMTVKGLSSRAAQPLEEKTSFYRHKSPGHTNIHTHLFTSTHTENITWPRGLTSALKELLIHPNDCPTTWKHQVTDCSTIMTSASDDPINTTNGHKRSCLHVSHCACVFVCLCLCVFFFMQT